MTATRLPITPILLLLSVSLIWGANWAVTKLGAGDFAPIFMATVRSVIASACLIHAFSFFTPICGPTPSASVCFPGAFPYPDCCHRKFLRKYANDMPR